jgi:hypothetical protein
MEAIAVGAKGRSRLPGGTSAVRIALRVTRHLTRGVRCTLGYCTGCGGSVGAVVAAGCVGCP